MHQGLLRQLHLSQGASVVVRDVLAPSFEAPQLPLSACNASAMHEHLKSIKFICIQGLPS